MQVNASPPARSAPPHPNHAVTLVLGGARSGKSSYAQTLASRFEHVLFVATATRSDDEMHAKIDRHRADRPAHWTTVEEPLALARVLRESGPQHEFALIDCLTLHTASLLEHYAENTAQLEDSIVDLCTVLAAPPCPVVLVSNEAGSGVVPAYALGRRFRDLLGELNQRIAAVATDAVLMVAGLPLVLKACS